VTVSLSMMTILKIATASLLLWALLSFLFFFLGLSSIDIPLIDCIDRKAYVLVEIFDCLWALIVLELGLYLIIFALILLIFI
jgi:hypothetical protein